jgi:hypothetical protein
MPEGYFGGRVNLPISHFSGENPDFTMPKAEDFDLLTFLGEILVGLCVQKHSCKPRPPV